MRINTSKPWKWLKLVFLLIIWDKKKDFFLVTFWDEGSIYFAVKKKISKICFIGGLHVLSWDQKWLYAVYNYLYSLLIMLYICNLLWLFYYSNLWTIS
jgi:hypothetical protein